MPLSIGGNTATVLMVNEALFGAPVSVNNFYTQRLDLDTGFYSTAAYANHMADASLGGLTDAQLATLVLNNVLGTDGMNNPVLNTALTDLFTTYHADRGTVIYQAAAADPLRGLPGTFALQVQNVNRLDSGVYLNSEDDARDQRNISIVVRRDALLALEAAYGAPLEKSLWGKRLLVNGVAKRVRIDFTVDGTPSGKYYYQTHVEVRDASQVRVQPVG